MTDTIVASPGAAAAPAIASPLRPVYLIPALAALGVMIFAINGPSLWFLNFVHVMAGVLWTGIDLFMGFVIGPIMRTLDISVRKQILLKLTPRTLFLMPTLSIITGTAGCFLAFELNKNTQQKPQNNKNKTTLVRVTLMTIQGLGYLLPTNLR